MPARYYDPASARFVSVDPAAPSAGDPVSLNAYSYCFGDPVGLVDPDGRDILLGVYYSDEDALSEPLIVQHDGAGSGRPFKRGGRGHGPYGLARGAVRRSQAEHPLVRGVALGALYFVAGLGLMAADGPFPVLDVGGAGAIAKGVEVLCADGDPTNEVVGARTVTEQLAAKHAASIPTAGENITSRLSGGRALDPRYLASDGWAKYAQNVTTSEGKVEVHYFYNRCSGLVDQLKVVHQPSN